MLLIFSKVSVWVLNFVVLEDGRSHYESAYVNAGANSTFTFTICKNIKKCSDFFHVEMSLPNQLPSNVIPPLV